MSDILTISNGDWSATDNRNNVKQVFTVQGISGGRYYDPDVADPTTYTTAYFNVWADGLSSNGEPYRVSGGRNVILTDRYGNHYSAGSAAKSKYVIAVNNMHMVLGTPKEPLPPIELPDYTFRFQFSNTAYNPTTVTGWKSGSTWTKVTTGAGESANQWDYTHVTANWNDEFLGKFSAANNLVDILYAGEFSGVTSMGNNHGSTATKVSGGTFGSSGANKTSYIRSVCDFNTENIVNMEGMFFHCNNLTVAPRLNTSACTSFWSMFDSCIALKWINGYRFDNAVQIRSFAANCSLSILPDLSTINPSKIISASYIFQGNSNVGEFGSPGISAAYSYLSACPNVKYTGAYKGTGSATSATIPQVAAELALVPGGWK